MKSIIIIAIVLLGCVAINQGRFFLLFFRLYCFFNFQLLTVIHIMFALLTVLN
jgi:hypothetical protein